MIEHDGATESEIDEFRTALIAITAVYHDSQPAYKLARSMVRNHGEYTAALEAICGLLLNAIDTMTVEAGIGAYADTILDTMRVSAATLGADS